MFERSFQWALKRGARLLFAVSLLFVLAGFVEAVNAVVHMQSDGRGDRSTATYYLVRFLRGLAVGWPTALQFIVGGLWSATFPLFGALVINRLDHWRDRGDSHV